MPRPRTMPESEALELALHVFWDRGYDRASIGELCEALGVGPSSIYNAFGSKAELFRRALDHYLVEHTGFVNTALERAEQNGAERSVRDLLRAAVSMYVDEATPPGCAIMQGGGAGGSEDSDGGRIAREFRQKLHGALLTLLKTAGKDEQLSASPALLANYLMATIRGLSQLACDGTSRRQLQQIADHAAGSCFEEPCHAAR